jgi:HAD superfamily phosphoserine phosphatase-like hydrolase
MHRVFISSTFEDLKKHRQTVRNAIRQLGAIDVSMENFGSRDSRPKEECNRLIREETDVFVGIYAHRYGFIPDGDDVSITETEYREALRSKVPTLIYLIDEAHPWPPMMVDNGAARDKLSSFKDELKHKKIIGSFTSPDQLAASIAADLGRHFSKAGEKVPEKYGLIHESDRNLTGLIRSNRWRYKLIAFDLDGTLLKGEQFDFSWEVIWKSLGFAKGTQSELKREYRLRSGASATKSGRIIAYQQWCEKACQHFKQRGLTRAQLKELSQVLSLTNNCRETMTRLREEGFIIAIISGGVNTFLEDLFPDFRDYVDFVYMNELLFDNSENLEGVKATAYDFEGKADALDEVCGKAGCVTKEAVFVGDHFNDEAIMLKVGVAIAYPPQDSVVQGVSHVSITEDNLLKIIPHVLVE